MKNFPKYDPKFAGDLIVTGYLKRKKNHGIWTTVLSKYVKRFFTLDLNNYIISYKEKEETKDPKKIYYLNDLFCVCAYDQSDKFTHPEGYNYSFLFDFPGSRMQLYTNSADKFGQMCQTLGCCFTFKKDPLCKFVYPIFQYTEPLSVTIPQIAESHKSNNSIKENKIKVSKESNTIETNIKEAKVEEQKKQNNLLYPKKDNMKQAPGKISNLNKNSNLDTIVTKKEVNIALGNLIESNPKIKGEIEDLKKLNYTDKIESQKFKDDKLKSQEFEIEDDLDNIPEDKTIKKYNNLKESPGFLKPVNNNQKRIDFKRKTMVDNQIQINQDLNRLPVYHFKNINDLKNLKNLHVFNNLSDLKQISDIPNSKDLEPFNDAETKHLINERLKESNKELNTSNNFSKNMGIFQRSIKPNNLKNLSIGNSNLLNVPKSNIKKEENLEYTNIFCPYKHFTNNLSNNNRNSRKEKSTDFNNNETHKININYAELLRQDAKKAWNIDEKETNANKSTLVDIRQFKEEINQEIKMKTEKQGDEIEEWD